MAIALQELGRPRLNVVIPEKPEQLYGMLYQRIEYDTPQRSRASLMHRMHRASLLNPTINRLLDLGSGRQPLIREYTDTYGLSLAVDTVDIAPIPSENLLAGNEPGVTHHKASGDDLPFSDNIFELVVSNLALSHMPKEAEEELFRVTKPGGHALLNLDHPTVIPDSLSFTISEARRRVIQKVKFGNTKGLQADLLLLGSLLHKERLQKEGRIYESEEAIADSFTSLGFVVDNITLAREEFTYWWEVDLTKPAQKEVILFHA